VSFFGNDAINRVNLHSAIQALAQGAGGVFVFVYLLRAGVPAALVLCTVAGMTAGRFAFRPAVLVVARRLGIRGTLIIGTLLEGAVFLFLPFIHGPDGLLLVVIAVSAFGSVFYWTSLHAYTAELGDAEHRGRQVSVGAAAAATVNILAPWAGGLALANLGPFATFGVVAIVQGLAITPLIGAPNPRVAEVAPPGWWRAARLAVVLQTADGWFGAGYEFAWQIALFVTLGEHFASFGGAMALAGLVGAAASLIVGRLVDLGHARLWVVIGYAACALVIVLKAASLGTPALAIAANALAAPAGLLLQPVMMTRVYNLAKASPCPLRFMMATEGGWDVGCCTGALVGAALTATGVPLSASILLALGGVVVGGRLLLKSYGAVGARGAVVTELGTVS
jgi:predicted MFS family arabinose efflux permease